MSDLQDPTENSAGRPTKFKSEFTRALIDFYDREPYEDVEIPHYKNGEVSWVDKKRMANKTPTLRDFAKLISVGISTIYDWINPEHASYKEDFSDAYTRVCKDLLKWFLIENGLNGCHNPLYGKFVATNMTDMRDKQDVEQSGEVTLRVVYEEGRRDEGAG